MRILFQGDSITDCLRDNYDTAFSIGCGYPRLIQADLCLSRPDIEVLNCAISGDRVTNLLARWKKDCINLCPDMISILIGVNDVWHELNLRNGVDAELFQETYRVLLQYTKRMLPNAKMILLGAYLTHGTATNGVHWEEFYSEVALRNIITRQLASEFSAGFLDLQAVFDKACGKFPAEHWTQDGVHPTAAGHQLIANAWKAKVQPMLE